VGRLYIRVGPFYLQKNKIERNFKMKRTTFLTQGNYPYMIHAWPSKGEFSSYPTHTHGLYDLGLPEFIIDPYAFGGEGNASIIKCAVDYFIDPQNAGQLTAVLDGQIIKLTGEQLSLKYMRGNHYVYCFRKVTAEFEAVKLAYDSSYLYLIPPMEWVQIWVDGEDHVLTDEYYQGGVKWYVWKF
jgi:hypothetical protein